MIILRFFFFFANHNCKPTFHALQFVFGCLNERKLKICVMLQVNINTQNDFSVVKIQNKVNRFLDLASNVYLQFLDVYSNEP